MRNKLLLTLCCVLGWLMPAGAQFIPGGLFEKNQGTVVVKVLEQGSEKPVPFASIRAAKQESMRDSTLKNSLKPGRKEKRWT